MSASSPPSDPPAALVAAGPPPEAAGPAPAAPPAATSATSVATAAAPLQLPPLERGPPRLRIIVHLPDGQRMVVPAAPAAGVAAFHADICARSAHLLPAPLTTHASQLRVDGALLVPTDAAGDVLRDGDHVHVSGASGTGPPDMLITVVIHHPARRLVVPVSGLCTMKALRADIETRWKSAFPADRGAVATLALPNGAVFGDRDEVRTVLRADDEVVVNAPSPQPDAGFVETRIASWRGNDQESVASLPESIHPQDGVSGHRDSVESAKQHQHQHHQSLVADKPGRNSLSSIASALSALPGSGDSNRARRMTDNLADLAAQLLAGVEITDRTYHFRTFPSCFVDKEAVEYMVSTKIATSVKHAVQLGCRLQKHKYIKHVANQRAFSTKGYFFNFTHKLSRQQRAAAPTMGIDQVAMPLLAASRMAARASVVLGAHEEDDRLSIANQEDEDATVPLETLAPFVPNLVFEQHCATGGCPSGPTSIEINGSILFMDLTGFTALAEGLSAMGSRGTEQISSVVNRFFSFLIRFSSEHGGDVLKTAGDALYILFHKGTESPAVLARRAVRCGVAIQEALEAGQHHDESGAPAADDPSAKLRLKIAVTSGPMEILYVGGQLGKYEFLVAGTPVTETELCSPELIPGTVVLSSTTAALVAEVTEVRPVGEHGFVLLLNLSDTLHPLPLRPVQLTSQFAGIRAYVQGPVINRLAATSGWARGVDSAAAALRSLAEIRLVTVLFCSVDLSDKDVSDGLLGAAQTVFSTAQDVIFRLGGLIRQFLQDDKGLVLIAIFGAANAHEDDAARAVMSAVELGNRLQQQQIAISVGVTTGRAFCGIVGSSVRCEYAVVGDTVNLAARLMGAAAKRHVPVLCDARTSQMASGQQIDFGLMDKIAVKGKSVEIEIYVPSIQMAREFQSEFRFVGRSVEQEQLRAALAQTFPDGQRSIILVEGPRGVGKTVLVQTLLRINSSITSAYGRGTHVERNTPFFAFRGVILRLIGLAKHQQRAGEGPVAHRVAREYLLSLFEDDLGEYRGMMSSLNMVFPWLSFKESAGAKTPSRSSTVFAVAKVLEKVVEEIGGPVAIFLDDAHLLDSSSVLLAQSLSRMRNIVLVFAMRPTKSPPTELQQLRTAGRACSIRLEALETCDEARPLAAEFLGAAAVDRALLDFLYERSAGSPLLLQQLCGALQTKKLVVFDDANHVALANGGDEMKAALDSLTSLEATVLSQLDAIPVAQLKQLKILSVLGSFDVALAQRALVEEEDATMEVLENMVEGRLLERTSEGGCEFRFRRPEVQTVLYSVILHSQKIAIHHQAGEYLETLAQGGDGGMAVLANAAWHRAGAGEFRRSAELYEQAAGQSATLGMVAETSRLLHCTMEQLDKARDAADKAATSTMSKRPESSLTCFESDCERRLILCRVVVLELKNQRMGADDSDKLLRLAVEAAGLELPTMDPAQRKSESDALWRRLWRHRYMWHLRGWTRSGGKAPTIADETRRFAAQAGIMRVDQLSKFGATDDDRMHIWTLLTALEYGTRDDVALAMAYALLAKKVSGRRSWANYMRRTAANLIEGTSNEVTAALVRWKCSYVHMMYAQWDALDSDMESALATLSSMETSWYLPESTARLVDALMYQGRYLDAVEPTMAVIRFGQDPRIQSEGISRVAWFWGTHDRLEQSMMLGVADEIPIRLSLLARGIAQVRAFGNFALRGQVMDALCRSFYGRIEDTRAIAGPLLDSIVAMPVVDERVMWLMVRLVETAELAADRSKYMEAALAVAETYRARMKNLIDRPKVLLRTGQLQLLQGLEDKAKKSFRAAISAATRASMPVEGALARFELARLGVGGKSARLRLLRDALVALDDLGLALHTDAIRHYMETLNLPVVPAENMRKWTLRKRKVAPA